MTIAIVAFDDDGYGYAFGSETSFLTWLEPQTILELQTIYTPDGERLELVETSHGWALTTTGSFEPEQLKFKMKQHEERFGPLR